MGKRKIILASLILFSIFGSSLAKAYALNCCQLCLNPYLGVDASVRYFNHDHTFGNNVFYRNYPEADIYLGLRFNEFFAIEGGYKATITQTKTTSVGSGQVVNVSVVDPPEIHRGVSNFKAWFGQLVGFYPVCDSYCVYLFGSVGLSHMTLFAQDKVVQDRLTAFFNDVNVRSFRTNKVIPNLGTGLQFQIDGRSSIRLGVKWENTSQFSNVVADENVNARLSLKDSVIFSLGFIIDLF